MRAPSHMQVISNAGALNTYGRLLPSSTVTQNPCLHHQLEQVKALSTRNHFSEFAVLYCGLEERLVPEFQGIGCIHKHHSSDLQGDADRLRENPSNPFDCVFFSCCDGRERLTYQGTNGAIEAGSSSGDQKPLSTLQILAPAPYEWFERWRDSKWRRRGQDYKDFKEEIKQRLLAELGGYGCRSSPPELVTVRQPVALSDGLSCVAACSATSQQLSCQSKLPTCT